MNARFKPKDKRFLIDHNNPAKILTAGRIEESLFVAISFLTVFLTSTWRTRLLNHQFEKRLKKSTVYF